MRQILEILRLLYRGADVLILDEPTAVLAPSQIEDLLALMRKLKDEGRTIVFISHKLDEVMSVADAITVMRAGRVVATTTPSATSVADLARAMVGESTRSRPARGQDRAASEPLFSARGLVGVDSQGFERLGPVDLDISRGEIFGVAASAATARTSSSPARPVLASRSRDRLHSKGAVLQGGRLPRFREAGVGYVSADRGAEGLCLPASIRDNFVAGREREPAFSRLGIMRRASIDAEPAGARPAQRALRRASTIPPRSLSGGNQQRLAIAREFERAPKLLVAAQPTRGVDIAGTAFIHRLLAEFRDRGGAILLVSESLDEILALSDRVLCLFKGRIVGEVGRSQASVGALGRMMLGQRAA